MEKFIKDLLAHQDKQTQLISEIRKELAASNQRTPIVRVDSRSISQQAYSELRQPLRDATSDLRTSTSKLDSVADKFVKLTREKTDSFYGFTSQKAFLYFGGIVLGLVLLFGFALYGYMDSQHRLSEANRHIRIIDNEVKAWIKVNPQDSKSFKKEVEHKLIRQEF